MMKKVYVTLALCLLIGFSAQAQSLAIGLRGGLNFSSFNGVKEPSSKSGYHFGAYARVKLGPIGVQPEAYYSIQGSKFNTGTVKEAIDANYLNVPVLIRFSPVPILNVHVGPQFGVLMGGDTIDGKSIKDHYKSNDLSAVVGVGADLPFGLNVSVRYVKGLKDINKVSGGENVKGSTFQLSIGYDIFKLGK